MSEVIFVIRRVFMCRNMSHFWGYLLKGLKSIFNILGERLILILIPVLWTDHLQLQSFYHNFAQTFNIWSYVFWAFFSISLAYLHHMIWNYGFTNIRRIRNDHVIIIIKSMHCLMKYEAFIKWQAIEIAIGNLKCFQWVRLDILAYVIAFDFLLFQLLYTIVQFTKCLMMPATGNLKCHSELRNRHFWHFKLYKETKTKNKIDICDLLKCLHAFYSGFSINYKICIFCCSSRLRQAVG